MSSFLLIDPGMTDLLIGLKKPFFKHKFVLDLLPTTAGCT
jgi:hypothetical protein